jgi:ascorbate-specific PTS system EIIC-type component UlaA
MTTEPADSGYPATLQVEYPDRPLNRLTTFFRAFTIIPIAIVLSAVSGTQKVYSDHTGGNATVIIISAGGVLVAGPLLMILFREKYPRWWFDWNLELTRFSTRVSVYGALLDDRYPSTDEQQSVRLDLRYPDVPNELNRWLPLVKWLAAIPHYILLAFLSIAAFVCIVIAWFAILFTGRYPRGLFDFVVGVGRWWLRVAAYAFLLTTDRYPPFSLEP